MSNCSERFSIGFLLSIGVFGLLFSNPTTEKEVDFNYKKDFKPDRGIYIMYIYKCINITYKYYAVFAYTIIFFKLIQTWILDSQQSFNLSTIRVQYGMLTTFSQCILLCWPSKISRLYHQNLTDCGREFQKYCIVGMPYWPLHHQSLDWFLSVWWWQARVDSLYLHITTL